MLGQLLRLPHSPSHCIQFYYPVPTFIKSSFLLYKNSLSLGLNGIGVLLFIVSRQPYAATFLFACLIVKLFLLAKGR